MEVIHNQNNSKIASQTTIQDEHKVSKFLLDSELELLNNLSEAFTIIHGGYHKKRRQSA